MYFCPPPWPSWTDNWSTLIVDGAQIKTPVVSGWQWDLRQAGKLSASLNIKVERFLRGWFIKTYLESFCIWIIPSHWEYFKIRVYGNNSIKLSVNSVTDCSGYRKHCHREGKHWFTPSFILTICNWRLCYLFSASLHCKSCICLLICASTWTIIKSI